MKVVAIIQARMGSTRLPGKVLKDLGGKTVLGRVVERLQRCKAIDELLVATTDRVLRRAIGGGDQEFVDCLASLKSLHHSGKNSLAPQIFKHLARKSGTAHPGLNDCNNFQ